MIKQTGGDNNLADIKLWGQDDAPPLSYKIQVGYIEIPKTIKLDEKWLDTPYRFKSFQDANQEAGQMFDGYSVRIVGSNDNPHWDAPSYLNQNINVIKNQKWYNVVGIEPNLQKEIKDVKLPPNKQYVMSELSKLRNPLQINYNNSDKSNKISTRVSSKTPAKIKTISLPKPIPPKL